MLSDRLSIAELADAARLSRRAVRYYVQQKLIPPPLGVGRGRHYDASHLERLRRLADLQAAGHSLDAIRGILDGRDRRSPDRLFSQSGRSEEADQEIGGLRGRPPVRAPAALKAQLWTRLALGDGIELHLDTTRYNPDVAQLLALRAAVRGILQGED